MQILPSAVGIAVLLTVTAAPSAAARSEPCAPAQTGGPVWVTADCVDPTYNRPVIDAETDLTGPVPHHKVSGHFEGTTVKFNVYLPPKSQWQGRFFQLVYPLQNENATDDSIAFGAASGAYTVQINGTAGYQADAAAAKFAKTVAAAYYGSGSRRIYGYIYGGSGGSYQTVGAMENTTGVWDGAVPFIPGVPTSIPNNFFVRAFARQVLTDKAAQIADAVRPGGSGDPYAGLTDAQRTVLREVTRMGVPLRAWEDYPYLLGLNDPQGLLGFAGTVRAMDPTYADDFWSKPGYLGTEQSPLGDLFRAEKVDTSATITRVNRDAQNRPASLVLDDAPAGQGRVPLDFAVYDGSILVGPVTGALDPATKVFTLGSGNTSEVLNAIDQGAKLRIDNRWSLALTAYHRHQVPTRPGFHAWDQFRDADGQPIHPQRDIQVGPRVSVGVSGGGTHTGKLTGKMIMVGNLLDVDAFPWDADWYGKQVEQALGARSRDTFRIWYNDHADHIGPRTPALIDATGILQQALRDVSAWVEKGVTPPRSTRYEVTDSQVKVPAKAADRRGLQPVVNLTANGRTSVQVRAGKPVTFKATIQVPPGTGKIVSTGWDFKGDGAFAARPFGSPSERVDVQMTFTYTQPGTYFPGLRATAHRDGDTRTPFATVPNLGRVRVVVR
ncbi:PKD domain-containing protein [Nonomuraea sp. NPDC049695]|uniref:PKD domain-containing protein n=1 Tax=Nonomuraea sp. NPDC049695 TaxID=3154734 RepID=UPI0034415185